MSDKAGLASGDFRCCAQLLEAFSDGIAHFDSQGVLIAHNSAFRRLVPEGETARLLTALKPGGWLSPVEAIHFPCAGKILELRLSRAEGSDGVLCFARDVTKEATLEDRLRHSEYLYKTFVDSSLDFVFLKDASLRYMLCNEAYLKFLGAREEDILGKTDQGLMEPATSAACRESDLRVLETREAVVREEDAKGVTYLVTKFPVRLKDGSLGVGAFIHDISARKRAERQAKELASQVRKEKKRLELIVNNTIDEIWFADRSGRFTLANPTALSHFDLPPSAKLDIEKFALSLEVYRPDGSPRPLEEAPALRSLKVELIVNQEELVRLPYNGQLRYREVSSAPIRETDGTILGCVSIVRDVTDKKAAEKEHRLNEERLRRIVDIMQHRCGSLQEFLDYALEQTIQLTASKIGYIYHYDEDKRLFILNTWSKEVMPECRVIDPLNVYELDKTGYWGEAVRQRKPMVNNDFSAPDPFKKGVPKGHVQLGKFMTIPVLKDQRIVAVVGVANKETDYDEMDVLQCSLLMESIWKVVDRIMAEGELKAVNEHLDALVQQRTNQLYSAMKEIESYSYTVSHDLKGHIRRISSFCELIAQDLGTRFTEQGRQYFERARANVVQMSEMTEEILKLSQVGRFHLRLEQVDISGLAADTLRDLRSEEPGRKCSLEVEPGLCAWADRELISLVMGNLLGNAWKYSSSREETRIKVGKLESESREDVFFIQDNGIGFDPKYKETIFQPFKRLNTEKEYPGTGIGLATVEKIISRHGGRIWAESSEGNGASFFFALPVRHRSA